MNSLFYCGVERKEIINNFIEKLDRYSEETSRPIYIIEKALGNEGKIDEYEYKEKIIVLIPKQKILLINLGKECEEFNDFVDDFIDDLEYLSKRYEYQKYIGRKRIWQDCIEIVQFEYIKDLEIEEILRKYRIPVQNERIVELLISLLIGSINDINKIGAEVPETLLDNVKKKIVLFDGMQIRLVSTYKGVHVSSMMFDSTGTKKIAAIASYVIEALEQGRMLVVDELDSSIHFKLTRAIVAMFNNELNTSAQMIFTVHDINLMDCKRMFRKEQIWFVHKDEEGVYVYSLADFTAQQGVRDTTDVMEKYRKGALGALPDPELINSLLSIKSGVKGDDADAK